MSSLDLLLQAARAEPDQDLPRLVLSDWLEENGQPERAELIRAQCRLARWVPDLKERTALQERVSQLLARHTSDWLRPLQARGITARLERGLVRLTLTSKRFASLRALPGEHTLWNQVEQVRLTGADELILEQAACPRLAEVSVIDLSGSRWSDPHLAHFLRSPHLGNLRGLDLSNNALTDASIPALLASGLLSRTRWLDLRNNAFSADGAARLAGAVQQGWIDLHGHEPSPGRPNLAWVGQRPGRLVNSIGMDLALISAGVFLMGANPEPDFEKEEGPLHEVEITRPFYLGVYPVTQLQYEELMGEKPSEFQQAGPNARHRAVESVSWHDAVEFCRRLSDLPEEKRAGRVYRLPTEAEWEHTCRAGTTTPYWFGRKASGLMANFDGVNFGRKEGPFLRTTTTVGNYPANGFGLCDIVGNVWEWCQDWYSKGWYRRSGRRNPRGPSRGTQRVIRGGCWNGAGVSCRSARRLGEDPDTTDFVTGFRVALSLPAESAG
jgi:uncharacterized protein (TIGR02996 family)